MLNKHYRKPAHYELNLVLEALVHISAWADPVAISQRTRSVDSEGAGLTTGHASQICKWLFQEGYVARRKYRMEGMRQAQNQYHLSETGVAYCLRRLERTKNV